MSVSGNDAPFLVKLKWSHWTASSATGRGDFQVNNCNPDCTGGTSTTGG